MNLAPTLLLISNMKQPKLLDLFCGAGGAAMGYHRAGFEVVGVDISPQPNYPFEFHQENALEFPLEGFDVVHASPPCQGYSVGSQAYRNQGKQYPLLIEPTRNRLQGYGGSWIIENVRRKVLIASVRLCGMSFGLPLFRHRFFESNLTLLEPDHPMHPPPSETEGRWRPWNPKDWRKPDKQGMVFVRRSQFVSVAGFGGSASKSRELDEWKTAMGIDWMTRPELVEAIPPAYTEYIGRQLYHTLDF